MGTDTEKSRSFGFYKNDSTDLVVVNKAGKEIKRGSGTLFLVTPWRTFARIPTTDVPIAFGFTELGSDNLSVMVQGSLQIRFKHELLNRRDFTVDPWTDTHVSDDPEKVRAEASHALRAFVRESVRERDLKTNITAKSDLQNEVTEAIEADSDLFAKIGVTVVSFFITEVRAANRQLEGALEAEARETFLAENARLMAETRRKAAEDDRKLKQFEAETALKLEEGRTALITIRNSNVIAEAAADAEATEKRLDAYKDVEANVLLALAIEKMAENGVSNLNITPDFLTALKGAGLRN